MIKLFVGLGNPGKEYATTRHNLGWMVIDKFIAKKKGRFTEEKRDYTMAVLRLKSELHYFVKPQTFMNLSGRAVNTLLIQLELTPQDLVVISDDFAIPYGKIRVRPNGSDGGHNGLSSIIETLGRDDFPRMRMGIGPIPEKVPAEKFVLDQFSKEELDSLDDFVTLGISCLESLIYKGLPETMNKYNGL